MKKNLRFSRKFSKDSNPAKKVEKHELSRSWIVAIIELAHPPPKVRGWSSNSTTSPSLPTLRWLPSDARVDSDRTAGSTNPWHAGSQESRGTAVGHWGALHEANTAFFGGGVGNH